MKCPYQHGYMRAQSEAGGVRYTCADCRFNTFRFLHEGGES